MNISPIQANSFNDCAPKNLCHMHLKGESLWQ